MNRNVNRGAITVYLSIVLSAVIMLSGILMDVVRIRTAEAQVRRAVSTAALSTLAGYDTKLKEEYGLFALHNSDRSYLSGDALYFLQNQLEEPSLREIEKSRGISPLSSIFTDNGFRKVNFVDLYDYHVENIEVVPIYNLTENEVGRQQIVEYMKYRAPVQFAENFMEKIQYAASSGKISSLYKQKTIIEKKLGKIEKAMRKLQAHIERINAFQREDFDLSPNSGSLLTKLCRGMIIMEIYQACGNADFGELQEADMQRADDIMEKIQKSYDNTSERVRKYEESLHKKLDTCIEAVEGGIYQIEEIKKLSANVKQDIENLKQHTDELKKQKEGNAVPYTEILTALERDISKYEKMISSERSQSILATLKDDLERLNVLEKSIDKLGAWIISESEEISSKAVRRLERSFRSGGDIEVIDQRALASLFRSLTSDKRLIDIEKAASGYKSVDNVVEGVDKKKGTDPRKSVSDASKSIIKEAQDASVSSKTIENPHLLPSYYINGSYPNKIFSESESDVGSTEGITNTLEGFEADFDEESIFTEAGFDFIVDFAEKLKNKSLDVRNEIYVNEYILKVFKDEVELSQSNTDGKSNKTFFDKAEVEYILCGNANEALNKYLVKGQIMLIRFGMNTLHIYSDSTKRMQALEIATAAAGATGFGIPIVHNLIMCAWGTAEAMRDIKDIYAGKKVPFIKTAENWGTDLLPSGFRDRAEIKMENSLMDFDYHDYLRLLLLVKSKEAKMNRIQDLIQLNVQQGNPNYKLSSSNTYIKITAQISIRYWFLTKLFVPLKYKSSDGNRHLIEVEVWRGY